MRDVFVSLADHLEPIWMEMALYEFNSLKHVGTLMHKEPYVFSVHQDTASTVKRNGGPQLTQVDRDPFLDVLRVDRNVGVTSNRCFLVCDGEVPSVQAVHEKLHCLCT